MGIFGGEHRRIALAALSVTLAMSVLGWMTATSASAALRADYHFQNTLASSIGAPPALSNLGPGANSFAIETVNGSSQTTLRFPAENGVQLASTGSVIPSGSYTIAVLFRFATVTSRPWQRIVDFQNGTSDRGLYVHDGTLELYPYARGATAPFSAEKYASVVLTRDSAGMVIGYVDGNEQFSYNDSATDAAVIDAHDTLRFFRDNESGGPSGESSAGAVARIQLYDEALTAEQVAGLPRVPPPATGAARANVRSLSFAARPLGTLSAPRTVVVTNIGHGGLLIDRARMTGTGRDDFLLSSDGCSSITLLFGGSCSIGVRFAPSASGRRSAILSISSIDPLSPLKVAVTGNGRRKLITCPKTPARAKHGKHMRRRCSARRRTHIQAATRRNRG